MAQANTDIRRAQHPAFQRAAQILRGAILLADTCIAIGAGVLGFAALYLVYGGAIPPAWLAASVFGGVALIIGWAMRQMPETEGIMGTIVENVRKAREGSESTSS